MPKYGYTFKNMAILDRNNKRRILEGCTVKFRSDERNLDLKTPNPLPEELETEKTYILFCLGDDPYSHNIFNDRDHLFNIKTINRKQREIHMVEVNG